MDQMKEQIKTPEKELNKMEISNLIWCRVQDTGYKDAQGTQWVLQQHKKDLGRNEGYTNWNKEQYTGINSGADEAKNQINDLKHKEEKDIQSVK